MNYMMYIRANKQDYDDWAAMGNDGWSFDEVLPLFKKSEDNRDHEVRLQESLKLYKKLLACSILATSFPGCTQKFLLP